MLISLAFHSILNLFFLPAANCGQLDVKYGIFDNSNYSYGNIIHVVGCHQGYLLKGHSEYECKNREGSFVWIPEVDAACICK